MRVKFVDNIDRDDEDGDDDEIDGFGFGLSEVK